MAYLGVIQARKLRQIYGHVLRGECSGALDAKDVAPPAARKARQMQPIQSNILLVGADHPTCQWLGLRALLQEQPDLHMLADVQRPAEALHIATDRRPDHILTDAAVSGMGLVPFVRQVRRTSPESRVVVIGTRETLRRDMLLQLMEQGARGYLLWEGLGGDVVVHCLALVREDELLVGQRAVLDDLLAAPERRSRPRGDEPALTDEERVALSLLIAGRIHAGRTVRWPRLVPRYCVKPHPHGYVPRLSASSGVPEIPIATEFTFRQARASRDAWTLISKPATERTCRWATPMAVSWLLSVSMARRTVRMQAAREARRRERPRPRATRHEGMERS
jgi:DNA-binding NarL/FixJ family response regulator